MKEICLKVSGMHCTGCASRIENAIKNIEGVKSVTANYETGEVFLKMEKDVQEQVEERLNDIGFPVLEENS